MQNNLVTKLASSYVEKVGLELEAFCSSDLPKEVRNGQIIGEAGKHQIELITDPLGSVDDSMLILEEISEQINGVIWFTPYRPKHLFCQSLWNNKPRYNALRQALEIEEPGQKHLVRNMTKYASIHVNLSGMLIDPFGEDGVFLVNMFNNLVPFLAAQIHKEIGLGKGHLNIWRKFARKERFPLPDRWFASSKEMVDYIESVPPLFRVVGEGKTEELMVYPGGSQSVSVTTDLTFMWWFMRVKIGLSGPYLELRYLPSMPLVYAKRYIYQAVNLVEETLSWYHGQNHSQSVCSQVEALPAFKFLEHRFSGYVPNTPLSESEWRKFIRL